MLYDNLEWKRGSRTEVGVHWIPEDARGIQVSWGPLEGMQIPEASIPFLLVVILRGGSQKEGFQLDLKDIS